MDGLIVPMLKLLPGNMEQFMGKNVKELIGRKGVQWMWKLIIGKKTPYIVPPPVSLIWCVVMCE